MNIKEAKQEIMDTVQAYLEKDLTGAYEIPVEKQRPILLMGPPGVGKTAIMEQVARDLGINLVSYTITHHTRQSAIGLPFIQKRTYGGKEYSVTEYTMSEIVASIYERIEKSGISEGILFLDEINCVSETLAPTMLQFLQYKTFGTHQVPDGFVIVTAGNPPEFNKSVRDLDIVTLDRVKRIDVDADFEAWKEYAYKAGVHGSILAYLEIRKDHFYSIHTEVKGRRFVTARGWEDLSRVIQVYEKQGKSVRENLVIQYLQDPEIAREFATYYELYNKYRTVYRIPEILEGTYPEPTDSLVHAPFDEKLSLISLLIDSLNQEFRAYAENLDVQRDLFSILKKLLSGDMSAQSVKEACDGQRSSLDKAMEAKILDKRQIRIRRLTMQALEELAHDLTLNQDDGKVQAKNWFGSREAARKEAIEQTGDHLSHCFTFLAQTYGESQEMVIFLSELAGDYYSLKFVRECGSEAYYKYNKLLLLKDRRRELEADIREIMQL